MASFSLIWEAVSMFNGAVAPADGVNYVISALISSVSFAALILTFIFLVKLLFGGDRVFRKLCFEVKNQKKEKEPLYSIFCYYFF